MLAIDSLHQANDGCPHMVTIVTNPSSMRAVLARINISVGRLKLFPVTTNIYLTTKENKDIALTNLIMGKMFNHPKNGTPIRAYVVSKYVTVNTNAEVKINTTQKSQQDEFIIPFWFVTSTPKQGEANCVLKEKKVTVMNYEITVPYIENNQKINAGDTLKLYVSSSEKRKYPFAGDADDDSDAEPAKKKKGGRKV